MLAIGILLLALGALLAWSAFTGEDPIAAIRSIMSGGIPEATS